MPILLAVLAAVVGAYFWYMRAKTTVEITHEILDAANDVRLAARRFGFKRRTNVHPAETIETADIALATLGVSFLELDDYPSTEQRAALKMGLANQLNVSARDADEMMVLGRWLMTECSGPEQAISRVGRKLYKLTGQEHFDQLMAVIKAVAVKGTGGLSARQKTALDDISKALRVS